MATTTSSSHVQAGLSYFKSDGRQQAIKQESSSKQQPDGLLNSHYPLYYYNDSSSFSSYVHCVGENFQHKNGWIPRSCRFVNLCLDLDTHEYVVFRNTGSELQTTSLDHPSNDSYYNPHVHVPTTFRNNTSVSIGGINTKWTWKHGVPRLEWFPTILEEFPKHGVYMLPNTTVWVPFHSMAGFNPGHLVWDDFLPIYTLLTMFQLLPQPKENNNYQLLLTRYILPGDRLWASCETRKENTKLCNAMFRKFLPLMGIHHHNQFTTNRNVTVDLLFDTSSTKQQQKRLSNYVCAKHAVAGLGMLTDHGTKLHGWEEQDFEYTHNHGRGGVLYDFRNWMMQNLNASSFRSKIKAEPPYRITFSVSSSRLPGRSLDFTKQIEALEKAFSKDTLIVQTVKLSELSLVEQIRIASESSIFVSVCGGGAVTATFLPQGGSVFLFFLHNGGVKNNQHTGQPARLDWDLFNNAAYLRTHWLPKSGMDDAKSLELFVQLVKHDLDVISHMYSR